MPRRLGLALFALVATTAMVLAQEPAPPEVVEILPETVPRRPNPWYSSAELFIGPARIQSGNGPQPRFGALVSPEFQVGYQFESGRAFHADFRFFGAAGTAPQNFLADESHRHRVFGQTLDLDFRFKESDWSDTLLLPFLRTRWELGLRAANFYLETNQAANFANHWNVGALRSDSFRGLGPHFDYRLSIPVPAWGLEAFTEVDLALLWGRRNQRLQPIGPYVPNTNVYGWSRDLPYNRTRGTDGSAGNAQWRVGLSWGGPLYGRQLRLTAGYVADYWSFQSQGGGGGFGSWNTQPNIESSDLKLRGAFLQAQWSW